MRKHRVKKPMSLSTQKLFSTIMLVFLASGLPARAFTAPGMLLQSLTVGESLEAPANIALTEKAPSEGLRITLTSDSPTRLLLSQTPDGPGSPSITVIVRPGLSHSPDFYVYGLSKTGSTTYTARAPGFGTSIATVSLAPSGILIKGPSTFGSPLLTTTVATPSYMAA